jgi:hypothetical protein
VPATALLLGGETGCHRDATRLVDLDDGGVESGVEEAERVLDVARSRGGVGRWSVAGEGDVHLAAGVPGDATREGQTAGDEGDARRRGLRGRYQWRRGCHESDDQERSAPKGCPPAHWTTSTASVASEASAARPGPSMTTHCPWHGEAHVAGLDCHEPVTIFGSINRYNTTTTNPESRANTGDAPPRSRDNPIRRRLL